MEATAAENKYLESQGIPPSSQSYPPQPCPTSYATAPQPSSVHPETQNNDTQGPKKLVEAYILGFALGFFGAHHFYLRRYGYGFLYFFTFGLLGCGYVADLIRMPVLVKEANHRIQNPGMHEDKKLHEAYVLWFPMGLFGAHNFYLRRWGWAFLYFFTFGLVGIGWLIDGCRMWGLVKHVNQKNKDEREQKRPSAWRSIGDVMVLTLNPVTGLTGVTHFYLGRPGFGVFYLLTLGGLGVGWLIDIFRMPFLVQDVNKRRREGDNGRKRLDDAYVLAFPLGFLGLHHFYLKRPCWGAVYFCTFGCLGIGWLIDLCRLSFLVKEYNRKLPERFTDSASSVTTVVPGGGSVIVGGGSTGATVVVTPNTANVPVTPAPYPQQPGPHPQGLASNITMPANAYPRQQMVAYPPPPAPQGGYPPPQGYPHPPPMYQPGMNYGAAGETSWSTINSSDFGDDPPAYEASAADVNPQFQNEINQQRAAPSAPPPDVPMKY